MGGDRVRHARVRTECGLCYGTPAGVGSAAAGRARCGPSALDLCAARRSGWVSSLERGGASATASTPRTAERINVTVSIVAAVSSGGVESGPASSPRARLQAHLEDLVRPGRGAQPLTPVHQHDQSRSSWAGGLVVGGATRGQRRPVEQGSHRQLCSGRAALRYRRRADGTARPPVVRQRRAVARSLHANAPVRHLRGSGPGAPPRPFAEAFTRPRCFACIRIGTLRLW